jgi:2-phosphosulfolactate phosphatase
MKIGIITSLKDADSAKGITVVIDVLRAFTTTCYVFANGAKEIISVADLDEAYAIKRSHPSYILIGERKGIKPSDFDWGNSPAELTSVSFKQKTVILTTSAGTQGIHKAIHANEVITGAFVNAAAIASYIQKRIPDDVTLLCTDDKHPRNEDFMCAKYIMSLLRGHPMDFSKIQTYLKTHPSADGFLLHPMTKWSKKDFALCMTRDTFDFVIKAKKENPIILERI